MARRTLGPLGLLVLALAPGACGPADEGEGSPGDERAERSSEVDPGRPTAAPESVPIVGADEPPGTGNEAGVATPEEAAPSGREAAPPADTIVLTARGPELAFYPDRVSAKSGSVVLLRFENGGELPHNVVLVRDDAAIDALASAAYEASESHYVPLEMRDELIAFSPLVSPGGTADLELTVPPPGEYTYICLFPGHAQMMLGTLVSLP